MAWEHKYTLLCDDVRREDNGKLIVLGLYFGVITVPQFPAILPSLTVLSVFNADRPSNSPFTMRVQRLENGRTIFEAQGFAPVLQPGPVVMPVKVAPVRFDEAGAYNITTEVTGQTGQLLFDFAVVLNPQIGPQPHFMGR
jgi:hypothetical protein